MNDKQSLELQSRAAVMALLDDEELARVATIEDGVAMNAGDEYVDLLHLERGIQRAGRSAATWRRAMRKNVLPRSAVQASTWARIVAHVAQLATTQPHEINVPH